MRQTRPKSIPNVTTEKLLLDLDQLTHRIDHEDINKDTLIRLGAKRTLVIFELQKRNVAHNYKGPLGSLKACQKLFNIKEK